MNIDAIRRLLAIADIGRDPYAVAEVAGGLLTLNAADSFAEGQYGRALSALKLPGAIAWQSRGRRFAANLRALERKDSVGAELVKAADLSRYQLHQSSDGNYQVLDTAVPVYGGWLGGLANHKGAESMWQFDRSKTPVPPPIIFQGLGFAWLFLKVFATTHQTYVNYSPAVHIVEGDAAAMAMLLHMHDLQEAIASSRSHFFIRETPEGALRAFSAAIAEDRGLSMPQQFIRCSLRPQAALPFDQALQQLAQERATRREQLLAETQSYYAGKDRQYWANRFEATIGDRQSVMDDPAARLRVLGITSRHTTVLQHSMAELKSAISSQFSTSVDMQIAIEPDDCSLENPFIEVIADFRPDLIIQISRLRYENPAVPKNVPFLCWDQDNLPCMRTAEATASLDSLTYVAGHGAIYGYDVLQWPRANLFFCHPAGATFRYHARPADPVLLASLECDISFVSNASGAPESLRDSLAVRWERQPADKRLFLLASERIIGGAATGETWEFTQVEQLVGSLADEQSAVHAAGRGEIVMALMTLADRCFRHAALHWVLQWAEANQKTFRLYGSGWENHPVFAPHAAGPAQPGEHLRAIYQASRINLQLIEGGFIHSRALDGLAAGGFFLTRRAFNDGDSLGVAAAHHDLARRAGRLGLRTVGDLAGCDDPQLAKAWAIVSRWYKDAPSTRVLRAMDIWSATPGASIVFSDYEKIAFTDLQSFARLAERYLADDGARLEIANRMRQQVITDFSYTRRCEQFLTGVCDALSSEEATVHA